LLRKPESGLAKTGKWAFFVFILAFLYFVAF
jgi:hypothetical protein